MIASTVHELSAAETWVDQFGDYLYSYAFYRVSDNTAAEDLVQDTFAAAQAARLFPVPPFFDEKDNWAVKPRKWQQNQQHIFEQSEFMDVLGECLTTISLKQADAFRLREISQISSEEICKVLDIGTSNYWILMHRARLQIRHCNETLLSTA